MLMFIEARTSLKGGNTSGPGGSLTKLTLCCLRGSDVQRVWTVLKFEGSKWSTLHSLQHLVADAEHNLTKGASVLFCGSLTWFRMCVDVHTRQQNCTEMRATETKTVCKKTKISQHLNKHSFQKRTCVQMMSGRVLLRSQNFDRLFTHGGRDTQDSFVTGSYIRQTLWRKRPDWLGGREGGWVASSCLITQCRL